MEEIIKKLKFKAQGFVISAPQHIESEFVELGFKTSFPQQELSENTLIFVSSMDELVEHLNQNLKYIKPDSVLWFAYPKGSSRIKTDINRDSLREKAEAFGLKTVTAISIDETWTGLRLRPAEKVGQK